ncbi:hypothetical protein AO366_0885 [Moraxella catarrhalis]|nr:hypothetical protein AO366_0885 [Moraxella catarrhalis]
MINHAIHLSDPNSHLPTNLAKTHTNFIIFGLIDRPSLGCCAKMFSKWATLFDLKFGLPDQAQ